MPARLAPQRAASVYDTGVAEPPLGLHGDGLEKVQVRCCGQPPSAAYGTSVRGRPTAHCARSGTRGGPGWGSCDRRGCTRKVFMGTRPVRPSPHARVQCSACELTCCRRPSRCAPTRYLPARYVGAPAPTQSLGPFVSHFGNAPSILSHTASSQSTSTLHAMLDPSGLSLSLGPQPAEDGLHESVNVKAHNSRAHSGGVAPSDAP